MVLNLMKKKKGKCSRCGFTAEQLYYDKDGNLIDDYCKNGNDPAKR